MEATPPRAEERPQERNMALFTGQINPEVAAATALVVGGFTLQRAVVIVEGVIRANGVGSSSSSSGGGSGGAIIVKSLFVKGYGTIECHGGLLLNDSITFT